MSDSELSSPPHESQDDEQNDEQTQHSRQDSSSQSQSFSSSSALPILSGNALPQLPITHSVLFTKNIFSRIMIAGRIPKIQFDCNQDSCSYAPEAKPVSHNTTSNLWKHLKQKHTSVYNALRLKPLITNTNSRKRVMPSSFFIPC